MSFTVAIVGRPNVGKSTLFNRLVGRRLALVDDRPGVTRDRREGRAQLGDLAFAVIDTAGLEQAAPDSLSGRMQAQTDAAIAVADAIFFVIDARSGPTPVDQEFANLVRKSGRPAILVANKSEGRAGRAGALEAYSLGLGEPVQISAEHGEGLVDLYDALRAALPEATAQGSEPETDEDDPRAPPIRIGITRDSIAVDVTWRDRRFSIHDTAGLRRRSRIDEKLEKLSVSDTLNAVRFAEVVIVMMDATAPFEEQDLRLADLIEREGRALVIGMSKWDLIEDGAGATDKLRGETDHWLPQVKGVPVVAHSGLTGAGLDRLMQAVVEAYAVWNTRVSTSALNRWLSDTVEAHPPPAVSGRRIRLDYMPQAKSRPPSFVLFLSRADAVPDAYQRYLVNTLRETFKLPGTPIRLTLREKKNPYAKRAKRK